MKDNNVNVNNSYSYSSPMSFSFRCNVGLITLGAVCIATCAAAFTGNTASTFVRHQQQHAHAPSRPSATLIKPLLFNKKGPLTLTQLSMADDDDEQQSEADDQNEWKALIAAFQMYKAAYGDLRVPLRFIVPSMPPWPSKYPCIWHTDAHLCVRVTDMISLNCLPHKHPHSHSSTSN